MLLRVSYFPGGVLCFQIRSSEEDLFLKNIVINNLDCMYLIAFVVKIWIIGN